MPVYPWESLLFRIICARRIFRRTENGETDEKLLFKNINHTLLTDFYELTMANGYFELGKRTKSRISICFSEKFPTKADLLFSPDWNRSWNILKICPLPKRISNS